MQFSECMVRITYKTVKALFRMDFLFSLTITHYFLCISQMDDFFQQIVYC